MCDRINISKKEIFNETQYLHICLKITAVSYNNVPILRLLKEKVTK
jgi:hypothetical protein